jgi:hypothetical protein
MDEDELAAIDLETAGGIKQYLAAALRALARLPFGVKSAHAISALASAQRTTVETSELEQRLAALEAAAPHDPYRLSRA